MSSHQTFRLFVASVCFAVVASCTSVPISNKNVQGRYDLDVKGGWFAGEYLVLREEEFEHGLFTDVVGDPRMAKHPVRGKYMPDGCLLTLDHPLVEHPHRIITPHKGRFIILNPKEADLLLQRRQISSAALYQSPLKQPN